MSYRDEIKDELNEVRWTIGQMFVKVFLPVFVLGVGISWLVQGNDFFVYKVFAPKYENARREVFENSKAYNQGMIQELQNMMFDYIKTEDANAKSNLASIILHRAADYDLNDERVPVNLRNFVEGLRNDRMNPKSEISKENN
jgi:hypothetical protein